MGSRGGATKFIAHYRKTVATARKSTCFSINEVDCQLDLPAVGKNLKDHLYLCVPWFARGRQLCNGHWGWTGTVRHRTAFLVVMKYPDDFLSHHGKNRWNPIFWGAWHLSILDSWNMLEPYLRAMADWFFFLVIIPLGKRKIPHVEDLFDSYRNPWFLVFRKREASHFQGHVSNHFGLAICIDLHPGSCLWPRPYHCATGERMYPWGSWLPTVRAGISTLGNDSIWDSIGCCMYICTYMYIYILYIIYIYIIYYIYYIYYIYIYIYYIIYILYIILYIYMIMYVCSSYVSKCILGPWRSNKELCIEPHPIGHSMACPPDQL